MSDIGSVVLAEKQAETVSSKPPEIDARVEIVMRVPWKPGMYVGLPSGTFLQLEGTYLVWRLGRRDGFRAGTVSSETPLQEGRIRVLRNGAGYEDWMVPPQRAVGIKWPSRQYGRSEDPFYCLNDSTTLPLRAVE